MQFGDKVTQYEQYLIGTYGYIIRLDTTPTIKKILSLQGKNDTYISDLVESLTFITDIFKFPESDSCPDIACALSSGVLYLFFKTSVLPYEDASQFLLIAYRYPSEITNLDSTLDLPVSDYELFIALSISVSAELKGKLVPQRILDKIDYFKRIINMDT